VAGNAHSIVHFETEYCFNVQIAHALDEQQQRVLRWLLRETFEPQNFGTTSFLKVRRRLRWITAAVAPSLTLPSM
jgi:hypothetical protein